MKPDTFLKGKFGVINERSNVEDAVIVGGECIWFYDNYDGKQIVTVRDSYGRIYTTLSKFFITSPDKLEKLYKKVYSRYCGLRKEIERLEGKKNTEEGFLLNRAWLTHPSWWTICQCQDCTESLEVTINQLNKYSEKCSTLEESLDNILQIMQINNVNFVQDPLENFK